MYVHAEFHIQATDVYKRHPVATLSLVSVAYQIENSHLICYRMMEIIEVNLNIRGKGASFRTVFSLFEALKISRHSFCHIFF